MTKKAVSSAYTRSLNDELPMLMLGLAVIWFSIQSIATVKSAGAYIHRPTYMYKHLITRIVKRKAINQSINHSFINI